MCIFQDWYRQVEYCRVPLSKQGIPQKYWNWSEIARKPVTLGKTSLSVEPHWHILEAVHCNGWKNCWWLKQLLSKMDVLSLMSIFWLYPGIPMSFERSSARVNFFLSACFCWDFRFSLREMDQNFKFGKKTIGFCDSYLEFSFCHFKVVRLHAKLHDAAGAVGAYSGKGPGYCCMIGRGPNSCLLGHVTRLLFYL